MDNDTKKILLLIARALQTSALAQSTSVFGPDAWQRDMADRAMAAALFAEIENEEKQREAAEKYMEEIYRRDDETAEKYKEEISRKSNEAEKNNV